MIKETMKILKTIIHTKLVIVTFLVLPVVVFILITSKSPVIANIRSFVVLTGSMEPKIPTGSIVLTQKSEEYNIGDVIAFNSRNMTVTHRIADIQEKGNAIFYNTKGDANNTTDAQPVSKANVIGKLIVLAPHAGNIILFLKTIPGFVAIIVFPTFLFVCFELRNILKEIEKEAEKRFTKKMQHTQHAV